MSTEILIFIPALILLLFAAKKFTNAASEIGAWLNMPDFVIGVFIIGIGTSLPELVSGVLSVSKGASEIVPGNILGSNISNLLLVTGLSVGLNWRTIALRSAYIYIDLHFLLGSFFIFYLIAHDGEITFLEGFAGLVVFLLYSFYLIKGSNGEDVTLKQYETTKFFPKKAAVVLMAAAVGIYFGANYTVKAVEAMAAAFSIPKSIVALTVLSLGTTLPELAVSISAIRQDKAEMAIGNVLGSCVFNSLMIPAVTSAFGVIHVPENLLTFSLPVMAAAGLFFYMLTQDKRISSWEGFLLVMVYALFLLEIDTG